MQHFLPRKCTSGRLSIGYATRLRSSHPPHRTTVGNGHGQPFGTYANRFQLEASHVTRIAHRSGCSKFDHDAKPTEFLWIQVQVTLRLSFFVKGEP